MALKTFKRYENKYLLNDEQYQAVMELLPHYMRADTYNADGKPYPIYNIYYDTEHHDIIRHSLAKPYYKEKLRLRSYSIPTSENDKVFLELKKKIGGVVSKRRAQMHLWEATQFLTSGIKPIKKSHLNTQVLNEIEEFLNRHLVAPKAFIGYDRCAFFGVTDQEFRVTFDNNIRARRTQVALQDGAYGSPLIAGQQHLMEVKISGAIPLWLAHVFSEQKIYSTSFSKYGTEYRRYCAENCLNAYNVEQAPAYSTILLPSFTSYPTKGGRSYA